MQSPLTDMSIYNQWFLDAGPEQSLVLLNGFLQMLCKLVLISFSQVSYRTIRLLVVCCLISDLI